jgi:uncharacterized membrane protein
MAARAKIRKHPVHPMIVPLPIGLWIFSFVSDVIYLISGNPLWDQIAFYTMAGGIAGALLAAIPGLIDLLSFKDPKLKQIGMFHMFLNVGAVILYSINLWLRYTGPAGEIFPFALSFFGIVAIGISGWLGGEMVYVYGVGVEPEKGIGDVEEDLRRHMTQKKTVPGAETSERDRPHPRHH